MNDHILVLTPPMPEHESTPAGILLAPALTPVVTYGRVVKVGPKVTDVQPGDMVAFSPEVGTPITIGENACLFLRESDVTATVPKREGVTV